MSETTTKKSAVKKVTKIVIADGKALTTKRGIKGPGEIVSEKDFQNEDVFESWKEQEFIVSKKVPVE